MKISLLRSKRKAAKGDQGGVRGDVNDLLDEGRGDDLREEEGLVPRNTCYGVEKKGGRRRKWVRNS